MNRKSKLLSILLMVTMLAAMFPGVLASAEVESYEPTESYTETPEAEAALPDDANESITEAFSDATFVWPLDIAFTQVDSPFGFRRATGRTHLG
ncbi:MAG: hypothetical protein FWC75_09940, partial [Oscillospiraceae bacterium]|nr:hypothetical protein [Oscillospiraceae bacterium]